MYNQNIYQMYESNGNRVGFKVIRNSWSTVYAVITSIGGKTSGPLSGPPPYYRNQQVIADVYTNSGQLKDHNVSISCPGTYGYRLKG